MQLYFRRSRAVNSVACGWMWPKIKLIQTFMGFLVTCNNEEDPFKNENARVVTTDRWAGCKSMQIFMMLKGS